MNKLIQNLYITYSNQKVKDIEKTIQALDKILTPTDFVSLLNEQYYFKKSLNKRLGIIVINELMKKVETDYFSFVQQGSDILELIYYF